MSFLQFHITQATGARLDEIANYMGSWLGFAIHRAVNNADEEEADSTFRERLLIIESEYRE